MDLLFNVQNMRTGFGSVTKPDPNLEDYSGSYQLLFRCFFVLPIFTREYVVFEAEEAERTNPVVHSHHNHLQINKPDKISK
jgi:hypothetical protein